MYFIYNVLHVHVFISCIGRLTEESTLEAKRPKLDPSGGVGFQGVMPGFPPVVMPGMPPVLPGMVPPHIGGS